MLQIEKQIYQKLVLIINCCAKTYDLECYQTEKTQFSQTQYYKLKCYNDDTNLLLLVL